MHSAQSIHMLLQKCILPLRVYRFTDTNEVKATLTRFTLRDAAMLRHIYSTSWSSYNFLKNLHPAIFKMARLSSIVRPFQSGLQLSPEFSQYTESGQQMIQLAFLRLTNIQNWGGGGKKGCRQKENDAPKSTRKQF